MRVTVTADDEDAPLQIAVEGAARRGDVASLATLLAAAVRTWAHGDVDQPAPPAAPDPPEPEPDRVPVDVVHAAASADASVRHAAYALFDRGRSIAQVAAMLGLDRDVVREWSRRGRW